MICRSYAMPDLFGILPKYDKFNRPDANLLSCPVVESAAVESNRFHTTGRAYVERLLKLFACQQVRIREPRY